MKLVRKTAVAVLLGTGVLFATSMGASAAVVCSGSTCWHTHASYDYPPDARVVVHEDSWKWGPSEKFTFREHEGRGYWRDDKWVAW